MFIYSEYDDTCYRSGFDESDFWQTKQEIQERRTQSLGHIQFDKRAQYFGFFS